MQSILSVRCWLFLLGCSGVALGIVVFLNVSVVPTVPTKTPLISEIVHSGLPVYLTIPAIHVAASIEQVGRTKEGAMDIPKGPTTTAWYNAGPRPGEIGSAVIVGHYGWKDGIPAVFDHVSQLRVGDRIITEDSTGSSTTFIVRKVQVFDEHADTSPVFISNDGLAHLNLITCGGIWNKARKSYSERTVVFADKEVIIGGHEENLR